jgi:hypothetical protein
LQRSHHFRCATQNPNWLTAPFNRFHLARLQISHVNLDWRSSCFRTLRWLECGHESTSTRYASNASRRSGRNQKAAPARVDLILVTHDNPNQRNCKSKCFKFVVKFNAAFTHRRESIALKALDSRSGVQGNSQQPSIISEPRMNRKERYSH